MPQMNPDATEIDGKCFYGPQCLSPFPFPSVSVNQMGLGGDLHIVRCQPEGEPPPGFGENKVKKGLVRRRK